MSFQPFGYRFEVISPHAPDKVKAAIRAKKKAWFAPNNGARGWIVGPFLCLWYSPYDQHGPMVMGLIDTDGHRTRIRGRAGSDLNGILMFSILVPLIAVLTLKMIANGSASPRQLLVMGVVYLIGGPLIYWSAHKDRRKAEPLVRFLNDALSASGRLLRKVSSKVTVAAGLTLSIGGEPLFGEVKAATIHDALVGVGEGNFAILSFGPETYLQTADDDGGYVIEKREGSSRQHFRAARRTSNSDGSESERRNFAFEEVHAIFMAYASAAPEPHFVRWERITV